MNFLRRLSRRFRRLECFPQSHAVSRSQEDHFRKLLDCLDTYVFSKDREGRYTYVNAKACQLFGRPFEEILGKGDEAFFSGESLNEIALSDREVLDRGERVTRIESQISANAGEPRTYLAVKSPMRGPGGEILGLYGISTDITEQVRAEQALKEQEEQLRVILETSQAGIVLVSTAGEIRYANQRMAEMFGLPLSELIGTRYTDHVHEAERYTGDSLMRQLIVGEIQSVSVDRHYRRKDGSEFWGHLSGRRLENTDGSLKALVGVIADISDRKHAQELLEQRVVSLTQPLEQGTVTFEELFNLEEIQRIQDEFALATGVASIITRPDGTPITRPSNFTHLCSEIIRKSEKGCANCFRSDAALGKHSPGGPIVQPCLSGGLWDGGASLNVGGQHIGNWLIGQVRDVNQTEDAARAYAREIGVEEERFLEAFRLVPTMSLLQFKRVAQTLFTLANQLSSSAYQNLQQARALASQRKAEASLSASEARNRAIIDALPDLLFVNSRDGVFLDAHAPDQDKFLVPPSTFLGKRIDEVLPAPLAQKLLAAYGRAIDQGRVQSVNYTMLVGGEEHRFEARIIPVEGDKLYSLVRDVTEQWKADQAVRQEQEFSRSVLESLPGIFYLYTYPELRMVACNRLHESHFGYGPGELIGRHVTEWYAPEIAPLALAAIDQVMETGSGQLEAYVLHRDGHPIPFYFTAIPFEAGGQRYLMGTGVDITDRLAAEGERQTLQARLQQTQRLESLGSLAGGVAHDMNNVLGAILGLASANLELQPKGTPVHRTFETIAQAAQRGGQMVKSLLAFARQAPEESREVDLNGIVREEVALLERTTLAKVRVVMELDPRLRRIRGDSNALNHALMNLCVNAVDAMEEGGTLTLRTQNLGPHAIELSVEDTGTGMSKEVMARALDPYFTTKGQGKGTGLGLSLVYSTVKSHQGEMTIESEPGQGTTVVMRFPACEAEAIPAPSAVAAASGSGPRPLSVLLVDDDELVQSSVQMILEVLGHRVETASSGEIALRKLEGGFLPDVVILDMNMPGLGGGGTLERLRALRPELCVLLATGRPDQEVRALVERYDHVHLLSKPFSIGELKERLTDLA